MNALMTKMKVLAVDDNRTNLHILQVFLKKLGHDVILAENGEEAVARFQSESPDLVLLDIMMPVMDGFEVCRRLAEDPRTRAIPVVFVSTKSQRADQLWARMQGGKALIGKPYSDAQVLDALRFAAR